MLEKVKTDMKNGRLVDWGNNADGSGGYSIREAANETDLFTWMLKWMPHVNFEVKPVLTVDQTIESIKKAATEAKRK